MSSNFGYELDEDDDWAVLKVNDLVLFRGHPEEVRRRFEAVLTHFQIGCDAVNATLSQVQAEAAALRRVVAQVPHECEPFSAIYAAAKAALESGIGIGWLSPAEATHLTTERDMYRAANQRDAQTYHDTAAQTAAWRDLLEEAIGLDDASAAGCESECANDFNDCNPHLPGCFVTRAQTALSSDAGLSLLRERDELRARVAELEGELWGIYENGEHVQVGACPAQGAAGGRHQVKDDRQHCEEVADAIIVTDGEIAAALALCEAATPGPWEPCTQFQEGRGWLAIGPQTETGAHDDCEADAFFIAAARTGWPAALLALREARRRLAEEERQHGQEEAHIHTMAKESEEYWRSFYEAEVARLREALVDASDLAEEGWAYAGDYFNDKWDSAARIAKCRAALAP